MKGYGFGLGVLAQHGRQRMDGQHRRLRLGGRARNLLLIDPKEQLIGIVMIQTRNTRLRMEYPNLYQAVRLTRFVSACAWVHCLTFVSGVLCGQIQRR